MYTCTCTGCVYVHGMCVRAWRLVDSSTIEGRGSQDVAMRIHVLYPIEDRPKIWRHAFSLARELPTEVKVESPPNWEAGIWRLSQALKWDIRSSGYTCTLALDMYMCKHRNWILILWTTHSFVCISIEIQKVGLCFVGFLYPTVTDVTDITVGGYSQLSTEKQTYMYLQYRTLQVYTQMYKMWSVVAERSSLYRTQVLVLAAECGFESRPWHLCPWARHLTIIASLHPGVKWVPVRAELVD